MQPNRDDSRHPDCWDWYLGLGAEQEGQAPPSHKIRGRGVASNMQDFGS